MTLRIYNDLVQRTDEWYAVRRGIVTASVVGKLITTERITGIDIDCPNCLAPADSKCVSKAKGRVGNPLTFLHVERTAAAKEVINPPRLIVADTDEARRLTLALAAERITNHTDPTFQSADMWRGVEDEPRAVDVYNTTYGRVQIAGFMVRDDWGFSIGYSPDGLVGDDGLIEVKSRRQGTHLSTILKDEVLAVNMAQIQCGLLVSGRQWCDYLSYCGGMRMWSKRIAPDPAWFEVILAAVERFENTAADMVAAYHAATHNMPDTERAPEMELVI